MALENSVARVLGNADPDTLSGTAFLFAISHARQLWMTCHHVIRELPSLHLAVYRSKRTFRCKYRHDLSSPQADIAILETRLPYKSLSSLDLLALPLGSPFLGSTIPDNTDNKIVGCGFSKKNIQFFPRGFKFYGHLTLDQWLHYEADNEQKTAGIIKYGKKWNIPFQGKRQMHLYEFKDDGNGLDRGLSGSPVCIEQNSASGGYMCIGMLQQRRLLNNTPTHGLVIPFEEIRSACLQALPFHPYADCVIVVLAAKKSEFDELCKKIDSESLSSRLINYGTDSRDDWKPFAFEDRSVKMMLEPVSPYSLLCQLSSEYVDRIEENNNFKEYLDDRSQGALLYIIDPCSIKTDKLRDIVGLAKDHNRGAVYVFPLCESISEPIRKKLKDNLRETLGEKLWKPPHKTRTQFTTDADDFINRVQALAKQAWEQFIRENDKYPRHRPERLSNDRSTLLRMAWHDR